MERHPAPDMERAPSATGTRFRALFIDHLVAWAPLVAIAFVGSFAVADPTGATGFLLFSGVLYIPLFIGYKTGMEAYYGQTYGKAACGITVRQEDGSPSTWRSALVRNLLLFVDFLPTMYLLGFYVLRQTKNRQRIGDLTADTVVVSHGS